MLTLRYEILTIVKVPWHHSKEYPYAFQRIVQSEKMFLIFYFPIWHKNKVVVSSRKV